MCRRFNSCQHHKKLPGLWKLFVVLCLYGGSPPNPLASRSSHRSSLPACACWRFVWCKFHTGEVPRYSVDFEGAEGVGRDGDFNDGFLGVGAGMPVDGVLPAGGALKYFTALYVGNLLSFDYK